MQKGKGMLRWRLLILVALLLSGVQLAAQDAFSNEVVRLVNMARSAEGLPPLIWNDQLAEAAQSHSRDMAQRGTLSHVGSDDSQFWERAARVGYVMVVGAQNVAARADLSAQNVVSQWQQNEANNANLLNPDYQEIGVGAVRSAAGTVYYTLLLGRRTDFTLPMPSATANVLFAATAAAEAPIAQPTVAETQTALPTRDPLVLTLAAPMPTATLDPRLSVTPPPTVAFTFTPQPSRAELRLFISQESITIQAVGDQALDLTGVELASERGRLPLNRFDNGFLTASLAAFPPLDCLQVWTTNTSQVLPRPAQCGMRHSWLAVTPEGQFWADVASLRVERNGMLLGMCSVDPSTPVVCNVSLTEGGTVLPTPTAAQPSSAVVNAGVVRLLIHEDGLTLQNLTGNSLDVSAYALVGDGKRFDASAWRTPELSRPLEAIPSGDCLQVWALGVTSLFKPNTCRFRHGWVLVPASRQFWTAGSFEVYDGDRLLGRCDVGQPSCDLRP